jgi:ABC transport system ATP-binding/permease protein
MYLRERTAGLSAGAYLLSKFVVLGLISVVQAALLVVIGVAGELPGQGVVLTSAPLAELLIGVAALTVASMALGLAVSALLTSSEKTMQALVLLSIGQVMLTGVLLPLTSIGPQLISYISPARWGFAATASTVNLVGISPPGSISHPDALWAHTSTEWLTAMCAQVVLVAVCLLIAWWWLLRISPGRRRR